MTALRVTDTRPALSWGPWHLDQERLALTYFRRGERVLYEVDLEGCVSAGEVLDWVAQVAGKGFASDRDLGQLVRALCDLLDPQAHLCPHGRPREIEPEALPLLIDQNARRTRAHRRWEYELDSRAQEPLQLLTAEDWRRLAELEREEAAR